MKNFLFIILILFAGNAIASSLPNCPSDPSEGYHNCFGTYTYANGDKYVGEWKDDKKNGQGTYTFADGENYVGEFKDDKKNGQGTYTFADGATYIGEYKDGKMHGYGTYTFANGFEESGYSMNDEYIPTICENMGLKKGSDPFGQCVVELIKQTRDDD